MQWGQIKLLFILSFLVLDIFLFTQFLDKQEETELSQISTESENAEEELASNDITFADDVLAEEVPNVEGLQSRINDELLEEIDSQVEEIDKDEQSVEVEDNVVRGTFNEPIEVTKDDIQSKVNEHIPFGSQYSFWGWNEEQGVALFFQKANDRTVYFNEGGYLLVDVSGGDMNGYVAAMLSFGEPEAGEASQGGDVIGPVNAVKKLYDAGEISSGDEITAMSIGYHSSFNLEPGEDYGPQMFAPTWKVTVNEEDNKFLYAYSGTIIDISESDFIEGVLSRYDLNETPSEESDGQGD
ncbi:UNVERIFIED_CONTAM: two-component system regulatory protein YycI [Halobacillus marinus]|uniref:two-component system regulatory protein YycI n=1 Tax=Halobacillus sp. KGW1 TaxID=1793726 RepID=UPI000785AEDA|nr:two-component system regulatory protein YycI [Halobacillus sp. KGW1]